MRPAPVRDGVMRTAVRASSVHASGAANRRSAARADPSSHRMLSLSSSARARGCRIELIRAGPDLRIEQTEPRLRLAVDGDHRMQEKPSRYAITRRPKATATLLAAGEIDLRRVLCRHNPTPFTGSRRAMRQCLNRDRGRRQEPMDRNLPRPRPPPSLRMTREPASTTRSTSVSPIAARRASPK